MKVNKWTLGLAAVGLVSLPSVLQAEEKMSPINTALASTTISGYVNVAGQWNFGTGNNNPPAYAYNTAGKADGFSLNAVKLSIEKPLDEGKWSAGYKADLMFGPDANSFGTVSTGTPGDFAVRQAYVLLRAPLGNGLDFKMGVFDTIVGYESHDAGNNPNYTRSYGYTLEPLSHTGLLATYQFSEAITASVGIANTVGPVINQQGWQSGKAESYKTYMGSVALTAPKDWGFIGGSTLYLGIVNGFNANLSGIGVGANETHYYAGATVATPIKELRVGAAFDYLDGHENTATGVIIPGQDPLGGFAWAASGYASFQLTEKLSIHGRGEYLNRSYQSLPGFPSKIIAATGTLQYDLWKNVLTRLEFRWDHAADGSIAYGGEGAGAAPNRENAYMLAANLIYKF